MPAFDGYLSKHEQAICIRFWIDELVEAKRARSPSAVLLSGTDAHDTLTRSDFMASWRRRAKLADQSDIPNFAQF